jgi:hypothetical protein
MTRQLASAQSGRIAPATTSAPRGDQRVERRGGEAPRRGGRPRSASMMANIVTRSSLPTPRWMKREPGDVEDCIAHTRHEEGDERDRGDGARRR